MKARACIGIIIIKGVTDSLTNLLPKKKKLQNICFINRTKFSVMLPCHFKCNTRNAINLAKEYHCKKLKKLKIGIAPKPISKSAMINSCCQVLNKTKIQAHLHYLFSAIRNKH